MGFPLLGKLIFRVKEMGMRNKKWAVGIALLLGVVCTACAQRNNPEGDFEVAPVDGGKSVMITK